MNGTEKQIDYANKIIEKNLNDTRDLIKEVGITKEDLAAAREQGMKLPEALARITDGLRNWFESHDAAWVIEKFKCGGHVADMFYHEDAFRPSFQKNRETFRAEIKAAMLSELNK